MRLAGCGTQVKTPGRVQWGRVIFVGRGGRLGGLDAASGEEDGDAGGGEALGGGGARASTDLGAGVAGKQGEQGGREGGGVRAIPGDGEDGGDGAGLCGSAAGGAGRGGWQGLRDAMGEEDFGDGALRGFETGCAERIRRGAGEIFDDEGVAGGDEADAGGVEAGVKQVGAVDGAGHPCLLDESGGCGLLKHGGIAAEEVFGDNGEMGTGDGGAVKEVGLGGVLVLEGGLVGDAVGVGSGGAGEGWIPGKRGQVLAGAVGVGKGEELVGGDGVQLGRA